MKGEKIPNFFIVGAPKCGTTALYEYLQGHPKIFMPWIKEPHYFAEDFPQFRLVKPLDQYMGLFQKSTSEYLAVGEASVWYLYSSVAISNIYQFNKNAKIIVLVRNPIDMIYSLHFQALYTYDEDEKDFETAWKLQSLRKRGINIPKTCREPAILQYLQVGKLGEQIERLLKIFSSEQVKVICLEDLKTSANAVYEDVLSFLGVPSDGRLDFPHINVSKAHKYGWLGYITQRPPYPWRYIADSLKKIIGIERIGVLNKIRQLNARKESRKPLSPDFRAELANEFREDIEKLSRILDKDLSSWGT